MIRASVANQKGGVGKTALSCHQGLSLAEQGFKVLFIDNDPQGNSSYTLQKNSMTTLAPFKTIQLYESTPLPDFQPETPITLVAADRSLSKVARFETEAPFIFREHLDKLGDKFDYCVMDNPPTLGLGLIASLVSSDFVYSPIEIEDYSISGLEQLQQTIAGVKSRHNPNLKYLGMIPNRMNTRDNRQKEKLKKLLQHFSDKIIKAPVVQRSSISEALGKGLPIWEMQKERSAAKQATEEIRAALDFIESQMGVKKQTEEA
ncbi:ParA family protein [Gilvimarinus chinensis]|uniref:ParA family protein n=1 Tax=Gilvimarinus chinensis TaxID=396005 RepID=UPI000364239E|nr:ParA family protein [Gilvimarinus chinensis]